ncbi:MAG: outer membrane beta-barrel protein [Alphaproteobacteria bacterium]
MRLTSAAALGYAMTTLASAAFAQGAPASPIYVQLDAGASMYNTKIKGLTGNFDTGWSLDGRIGRYASRLFRTELELGYEEANTDQVGMKGTVSNFDIMANGILDIPTESSFTPYLGVGIGGAHRSRRHRSADPAVRRCRLGLCLSGDRRCRLAFDAANRSRRPLSLSRRPAGSPRWLQDRP